MPIQMSTTDERTARIPVPATQQDTETLGIWLKQAGEEGFNLTKAVEIRGMDTVALRLTVGKS